MVSIFCIFFTFILTSYVQGLKGNTLACHAAAVEMAISNRILGRALGDYLPVFQLIYLPEHINADAPARCRRMQFSLAAQNAENVLSRCTRHPEQCNEQRDQPLLGPDVYRVAAKLCESDQAIHDNVIRALVPCYVSLYRRWSQSSEADRMETERVAHLMNDEMETFSENSTIPCVAIYGRKYACRRVELEVAFHASRPNAHIRDICGQKAQNLLLELQERVMNALHCSEFGDYVKELGWLKVNYQANKTVQQFHR